MSNAAPPPAPVTVNAGHLIARRLKASGIDTIFTLSGGHLFSIYDGCRAENIRLIDTRHEQTAAFAAEGWSKVTRVPGVAALTAGPGVTNGMSAMAAAQQNQSPLVVLGGRAPALRWGQGSLQEDRKSTRLNSSHQIISYAVFCLKKKKQKNKSSTIIKQKNNIKPHHLP